MASLGISNNCSLFQRVRSASQIYVWASLGLSVGTMVVLARLPLPASLAAQVIVALIAVQLAMVAGVTAIHRSIARRDVVLLFVGSGFLGATILGAQHMLFVKQWTGESMPRPLAGAGGSASLFLALALLLAAIAFALEPRLKRTSGMNLVRSSVALIIGFACAGVLRMSQGWWSSLPRGVDELTAGCMYFLAWIGFLTAHRLRPSTPLLSIAVAAAILTAAQFLLLTRSEQDFGSHSLIEQVALIASCACVLVGLIAEDHRLYTDIRKREQAGHDQRELRRAILDKVTDAIVTLNIDGNIQSYNSAAERLFRFRPDQIIGRHITALLQLEDCAENDQLIATFLQSGAINKSPAGRNLRGRRAGGSVFPARFEVYEVRLSTEQIFACIVRDSTEQGSGMQQLSVENAALVRDKRRAESSNVDLTRSNEDLKQFAYVASHDLQEPLRKVIAFCQLLRDDYGPNLDDNARMYIKYAVDGALRMRTLVQDLLTYSRVETQGKPLEPINAGEVCAEAIENLASAIEDASAEVVCGQLPIVLADRAQLLRLFQNLIGNAIKYRGDATPRVEITAVEREHQSEFRIRDNGIGIDPQYHDRIFVIFQRLHAREEYSGTGIGLAVCKRIVERAEGQIWVESSVGAGSVFCFTLLKANDETNSGPRNDEPQIAGHCSVTY